MSFKDPTGFPTRSRNFSRNGFHSSYSRNHYPCRSKFSEDDFVELEQVHCVAPQAARSSQKKTRSSRRSSNDLFSGSIFPADQKHFFQFGKRRAHQHSADIFYHVQNFGLHLPNFSYGGILGSLISISGSGFILLTS